MAVIETHLDLVGWIDSWHLLKMDSGVLESS